MPEESTTLENFTVIYTFHAHVTSWESCPCYSTTFQNSQSHNKSPMLQAISYTIPMLKIDLGMPSCQILLRKSFHIKELLKMQSGEESSSSVYFNPVGCLQQLPSYVYVLVQFGKKITYYECRCDGCKKKLDLQ